MAKLENIVKEIEELSKKHNLKFDFNSGYLRENMRKILIETKFVRSEKELNELNLSLKENFLNFKKYKSIKNK